MKRAKSQQSKHDDRVGKIAGGYKSQGWKVQADVPGYSKPRTIFNKRPDVRATKGVKERIIEVETKSSMKSDVSQRNAFKRFAELNNKRKFRTSKV
jgi:ribosomal protein S6E (S10)